jgi:hypothetical protein
MRLAGILLRFGAYDTQNGKETESLPLLNQAIVIAANAGSDRLGITANYLKNVRGKMQYPSQQVDLELLHDEITAYKQIEGIKSKHAANLCREFIQKVSSIHGISDRWKAEQCKPLLTDFESILGIYDPLTLQVLSASAKELQYESKYYDAMLMQRKVVAGTKEAFGPRSHETGVALEEYAKLLYSTNDIPNAQAAAREAIAILGSSPELDGIAHIDEIQRNGAQGRPR